MSRGPSRFRQREVARLVKAATAAGLRVTGVRVDKSGAIEVVTGDVEGQDSADHRGNEWDSVLSER
jgi:hypothetical protein